MTNERIIKGKTVVPGHAQGKALVADATLSFWGEVDAVTGEVIAVGHPLQGQSIKDRVLIIRSTKGSSGAPMMMNIASLSGAAPVAMINVEVDALAALGSIVNHIPMMTDLDENPFDCIKSGDHVVVDASKGIIYVNK